MGFLQTVTQFFQSGGIFMYAIAALLAWGLAVAIERYIALANARSQNQRSWSKISSSIQSGEHAQALASSEKDSTAVGRIVQAGLQRLSSQGSRDQVEMAMEETLMESIPQLEKRTHYLATIANVATLTGLLGTIMGLIKAFTAIAEVNPAEKADLLSASISVAMNTTAFGLMTAIPLLLAHAYLQNRTTELVDGLEMVVVKFLNTLNK